MELKESVYKNEYEAFINMLTNEKLSNDLNKNFSSADIEFLSNIKNEFLHLLDKINTIKQNEEIVDFLVDLLKKKHAFPILGTEDEWYLNGYNKRNLNIFKNKYNEITFDGAIMFYDKKNGTAFYGEVERVTSKQSIKHLPFLPRVFFVEVKLKKNEYYCINNKKELKEALTYYKT